MSGIVVVVERTTDPVSEQQCFLQTCQGRSPFISAVAFGSVLLILSASICARILIVRIAVVEEKTDCAYLSAARKE